MRPEPETDLSASSCSLMSIKSIPESCTLPFGGVITPETNMEELFASRNSFNQTANFYPFSPLCPRMFW